MNGGNVERQFSSYLRLTTGKKNTIPCFSRETYLIFIILLKLFRRCLECKVRPIKRKRAKKVKKKRTYKRLLNFNNYNCLFFLLPAIDNALRYHGDGRKGRRVACIIYDHSFFFQIFFRNAIPSEIIYIGHSKTAG